MDPSDQTNPTVSASDAKKDGYLLLTIVCLSLRSSRSSPLLFNFTTTCLNLYSFNLTSSQFFYLFIILVHNRNKKKDDKKKGHGKFDDATTFVNNTPHGALKDFSAPMADAYYPQQVEAAWDAYWETQGFYKPDPASDAPTFVMVIPPPNVTGTLHLGHALTCSVEDCITRWHRMSGYNTLWVPGTDHAGIATQVVVEKKLMREEKKTRHDYGRDEFIRRVWDWKDKNGSTICNQLRRLGASVDWSREAFTMDDNLSKAVLEAFMRLHKDGLIYRANRLVNWSCALRTAISTIEVEYVDLDEPKKLKVPGYDQPVEFGVIHSFAYKFENSEDEIIVATTRIETMLGDVAVAVHPDDERYKKHHGSYLVHPFIPERRIKLITDSQLVDMNFGTGAVKITPAHDPNDYACGQRQNLPFINIFTDDGHINSNGGSFAGMPRFAARQAVIDELTKLGAYRGKAANKMAIGLCSRSKDVIEPVIRPQWYVDCKSMAARAVDAVKKGDLEIQPEHHQKIWYHWLENIQDWCISRQLWWGHRIPAYHVSIQGQDINQDEKYWIVARNIDDALQQAKEKFPDVDPSLMTFTQDPDVLDTWFSSGLFPFSTLGWPNVQHPDFTKFYPTSLLETGHDILFFWVARMVMMGLQLTDQLPFKKVYLHAMVRDKFGRKMSKSLGNVVDPLDVIHGISLDAMYHKLLTGNLDPSEVERAADGQRRDFPDGIAECGADALRFGLLAYTSQGRDINLDIQRVVSYRQFCNKIWQATRFALLNFDASFERPKSLSEILDKVNKSNNLSDRWIMNKLHETVAACDKAFLAYDFSDVCTSIYNFWLYNLCDVYLELIKPIMREDTTTNEEAKIRKDSSLSVLYICLEYGLKLLHPLMPFVTDELYHRLPGHATLANSDDVREKAGSIMVTQYPKPTHTQIFANQDAEEAMKLVQEIGKTARSVRAALNVSKQRQDQYVVCSNSRVHSIVSSYPRDITVLSFARITTPVNTEAGEKAGDGCVVYVVNPEIELHIPLEGLVEIGIELAKMEKSYEKVVGFVNQAKEMQASANYSRMPEKLRQQTEEKLKTDEEEKAKLEEQINRFRSMMNPTQEIKYYEEKIRDGKEAVERADKGIAKVMKALPADPAKQTKKSLQMLKEEEDAKKKAEEQVQECTAKLAQLTCQSC